MLYSGVCGEMLYFHVYYIWYPHILCRIFFSMKAFSPFHKRNIVFFSTSWFFTQISYCIFFSDFLPKYHNVYSSVSFYSNIILYILQWVFTRISYCIFFSEFLPEYHNVFSSVSFYPNIILYFLHIQWVYTQPHIWFITSL